MLNVHKTVPRRSISIDVSLREVTASRHRCSFSFISLENTTNQRTNIQRPSVFISHPRLLDFEHSDKTISYGNEFSRFFFSGFPSVSLPSLRCFICFPTQQLCFEGLELQHLQCSVKKLYIYLFYSCLVFYSSPLYIKTNKLFLEMSSFSLGTAIFWPICWDLQERA